MIVVVIWVLKTNNKYYYWRFFRIERSTSEHEVIIRDVFDIYSIIEWMILQQSEHKYESHSDSAQNDVVVVVASHESQLELHDITFWALSLYYYCSFEFRNEELKNNFQKVVFRQLRRLLKTFLFFNPKYNSRFCSSDIIPLHILHIFVVAK